MSTTPAVTTYSLSKSRIRWGRVILAAVLSEVCVIATILAAIAVYSFMVPGEPGADIGARLGYYVAPPAGALATFLLVLWVLRRLESQFILHGVLVGIVSVLLTAGFLVSARPEDRPMYLAAFALRILAGFFAGWIAQRRNQS